MLDCLLILFSAKQLTNQPTNQPIPLYSATHSRYCKEEEK
jgi:hypothetical protein